MSANHIALLGLLAILAAFVAVHFALPTVNAIVPDVMLPLDWLRPL